MSTALGVALEEGFQLIHYIIVYICVYANAVSLCIAGKRNGSFIKIHCQQDQRETG